MQPRKRRACGVAVTGCLVAAVVAIWPFAARSSILEAVDTTALRVCADPSNLPFSNKAGEGFENKIADLLAEDLGVPVRYTWFPQVMGFVRNTLRARKCDIIIGVVGTDELAQNTNAYYRSAYVLVHRADAGLAIDELKDPALQGLRIGAAAGTPPTTLLARYGLMDQVEPYHLQVDTRYDAPAKSMVEDVADGTIDVAVLWGPIAGYYARQHEPPLTVVPLLNEPSDVRMDYRITMGVRYGEPEWKHRINDLIRRHQDEIDAILTDYGVPLLDRQGKLVAR